MLEPTAPEGSKAWRKIGLHLVETSVAIVVADHARSRAAAAGAEGSTSTKILF